VPVELGVHRREPREVDEDGEQGGGVGQRGEHRGGERRVSCGVEVDLAGARPSTVVGEAEGAGADWARARYSLADATMSSPIRARIAGSSTLTTCHACWLPPLGANRATSRTRDQLVAGHRSIGELADRGGGAQRGLEVASPSMGVGALGSAIARLCPGGAIGVVAWHAPAVHSEGDGLVAPAQRFIGKVALLTGAGSGIGRATAVRLAEEGAQLFLFDISAEGLAETVALAQDAGGEVRTRVGDVSQRDECFATVAECVDTFGKLDVLGQHRRHREGRARHRRHRGPVPAGCSA
jgi:hypothetical protein